MNQNTKTSTVKNMIFPIIYAVLLAVATVCASSFCGVLRTVPIILAVPAVATLFFNKKRLTIALCLVFVFMFCLVQTSSLKSAAVDAVIATCFAAVGIFIKRLIVTAIYDKRSRIFSVALSAILFVASVFLYFYIFGNPVSAVSAQAKNNEYIKNTYSEKTDTLGYESYKSMKIGKCSYDFSEKRYFTEISFRHNGAEINASVCATDNTVIDGFKNYFEYEVLRVRRDILVDLLEISFPNEATPEVRGNSADSQMENAALSQNADDLLPLMAFDVVFYTTNDSKDDFAQKCAEYDAVISEEFRYGKITYYCVYADEFLYEMTVERSFDGNYSDLVKDFSDEGLERHDTKNSLYDHWNTKAF